MSADNVYLPVSEELADGPPRSMDSLAVISSLSLNSLRFDAIMYMSSTYLINQSPNPE